MTDAWDPSIPSHKALGHQIELGNGIPEMRPIANARAALVKVGFEIEHEEDLAERVDHVPWYYPLEGDISKAQTAWDYFTVWRMSWSGMFITHNVVWLGERLGLLPKGTFDVGESLKVAGASLVEGGRTKVRNYAFYRYRTLINSFLSSCSRPCTSLSAASRLLKWTLYTNISYHPLSLLF